MNRDIKIGDVVTYNNDIVINDDSTERLIETNINKNGKYTVNGLVLDFENKTGNNWCMLKEDHSRSWYPLKCFIRIIDRQYVKREYNLS